MSALGSGPTHPTPTHPTPTPRPRFTLPEPPAPVDPVDIPQPMPNVLFAVGSGLTVGSGLALTLLPLVTR